MKAIGILGGTFDPVHFGHLRMAEETADALHLGHIKFVPAGLPYHRNNSALDANHRAAMVELAIEDNPRFSLDIREIKREGASYTVDTLRELRAELGFALPIIVIMGTDAFSKVHTWHRYEELFKLAHIAILTRAGMRPDWFNNVDSEVRKELRHRLVTDERLLHDASFGHIISIEMTPLAISSTDVRNRIRAGKSVRYLLPNVVLEYIENYNLYLE